FGPVTSNQERLVFDFGVPHHPMFAHLFHRAAFVWQIQEQRRFVESILRRTIVLPRLRHPYNRLFVPSIAFRIRAHERFLYEWEYINTRLVTIPVHVPSLLPLGFVSSQTYNSSLIILLALLYGEGKRRYKGRHLKALLLLSKRF